MATEQIEGGEKSVAEQGIETAHDQKTHEPQLTGPP
jgi:hypothetical protein